MADHPAGGASFGGPHGYHGDHPQHRPGGGGDGAHHVHRRGLFRPPYRKEPVFRGNGPAVPHLRPRHGGNVHRRNPPHTVRNGSRPSSSRPSPCLWRLSLQPASSAAQPAPALTPAPVITPPEPVVVVTAPVAVSMDKDETEIVMQPVETAVDADADSVSTETKERKKAPARRGIKLKTDI